MFQPEELLTNLSFHGSDLVRMNDMNSYFAGKKEVKWRISLDTAG